MPHHVEDVKKSCGWSIASEEVRYYQRDWILRKPRIFPVLYDNQAERVSTRLPVRRTCKLVRLHAAGGEINWQTAVTSKTVDGQLRTTDSAAARDG
jgi:hypothetical protein